jgi:hypothetical protein
MTWPCVGAVASAGVCVAHGIGVWNKVMGMGGLTLSSLVRSTWDAIISVGLSVGLTVVGGIGFPNVSHLESIDYCADQSLNYDGHRIGCSRSE